MPEVAAASLLNAHGVPPCPECGKDDFKAKTAWGLHRKQKHGIAGQSVSAVANRALAERSPAPAAQSEHSGEFPCDHCSFVSKSERGLNVHRGSMHGSSKNGKQENKLTKAERNGSSGTSIVHSGRDTSHELTESPESIALVGIAIGEVKGICRAIAEASGYPTRQLTNRVAEYLYRETRRG